mmetsp:Transcript_10933/g.24490  ORF Transcript_10933/g.24490 Transcript_10933/m.24490 type:complete len:207 (+) Transcript_10933:2301-2921(+)
MGGEAEALRRGKLFGRVQCQAAEPRGRVALARRGSLRSHGGRCRGRGSGEGGRRGGQGGGGHQARSLRTSTVVPGCKTRLGLQDGRSWPGLLQRSHAGGSQGGEEGEDREARGGEDRAESREEGASRQGGGGRQGKRQEKVMSENPWRLLGEPVHLSIPYKVTYRLASPEKAPALRYLLISLEVGRAPLVPCDQICGSMALDCCPL